jgi:hypothetical protein
MKQLIWGIPEAIYFSRQVWTTQITLRLLGKISFLAQASNPSFMPSNRGVRQGIALTVNLMAVDPTPENISPFQAVC